MTEPDESGRDSTHQPGSIYALPNTEFALPIREFEACRLMSEAACRVVGIDPHIVLSVAIDLESVVFLCYRMNDNGEAFHEVLKDGRWQPIDNHGTDATVLEGDQIRIAAHTLSYRRPL